MTQGSGTAIFLNSTTPADSGALCAETISGYNCIRRTYKGSATSYGVLAGLQANIPVGKKFALNPFLLAMPSTADTNKGDAINSSHIRLDRPITVGTSGGTQVSTSQTDFIRAIPRFSMGLNAVYRPWGISANLTASLFTALTNKSLELQGNKILKLQLSKSFGNFPK